MADLLINFKTAGDQVVIGALRNIGGGLVNIAGNALGAATDAFADFAKESFSGAIEAQKGIDELTASIAHLGNKSPITTDQAMALADQFKNLVGGSDDVVLAMTNVGLRFNSISSDLMPRFIEQSADLATALGIDPVKSAQMLGKVLEDIGTDGAGSIGKLTAAGVQLSDAQKDQILAMVEMGDVAGAQQLVLDALAETTGGKAAAAAETFAGRMAIFQESIADAGEGVMMSLLPALETLADEVLPVITPLIGEIAAAASEWITGVFVPALLQAVEWVKANWPAIQQAIADGWAAMQPVLQAVWDFIQTVVIPGFQAAVAWVVENWPGIQATISDVMTQVQAVIEDILSGIQAFWDEWGDEILGIVDYITAQVQTLFNIFSAAFEGDWHEFGEQLRVYFDTAWQGIMLIVQNAIAWFLEQDWGKIGSDIIAGIANGITGAVGFLRDAAVAAASAAYNAAKGFLGIQSPSKMFAELGAYSMQGFAQGISNNAALPAYAAAGAAYATTVSVGNIIIPGSDNPSATGYAVQAAISDMAREGYARARMR